MHYIKPQHRANLDLYKYSGVDKSLLSRYVLTPYWNGLVQLFPLWIAPNVITLLGLFCIAVNLATLLYFTPDLSEPCPSWVYYTFALGLWIYASFDAIDGKQARRTGTSGPLGELFDHCCDALNTTLGVFMVGSALGLPQSWLLALSHLFALVNFYLTTWEEYHTGTLYLSYFSGPVEGLIILCIVYITTGFKGVGFWNRSLHGFLKISDSFERTFPQLSLQDAFMYFGAVVLVMNIIVSSWNVVRACKSQKKPLIPALLGLFPFAFMSALEFVWLAASPQILTRHLIVFLLYIGISFGYQVGLIITAHVTKAPFPYWNVSFYPLLFGVANALLRKVGISIIDNYYEIIYVHLCLAFSALLYGHFVVNVIRDICDYFDINCFTIKRKMNVSTKVGDGTVPVSATPDIPNESNKKRD
ncbi:2232_t:CDS:2 [Paraglomus brasilianum]|uniref:2232_t:CDS:1 n=1 Tax=Paraglomus brasilianum TaxID=144538 RepID=A0A9N9FS52_9GLOM|nr:2232_t:CDS:2 [Paraglomus brasilianum]